MDTRNLDERVCANIRCGSRVAGHEFVLQVSTGHLRWFCGIDCAVEGQEAAREEAYREVLAEIARERSGG